LKEMLLMIKLSNEDETAQSFTNNCKSKLKLSQNIDIVTTTDPSDPYFRIQLHAQVHNTRP